MKRKYPLELQFRPLQCLSRQLSTEGDLISIFFELRRNVGHGERRRLCYVFKKGLLLPDGRLPVRGNSGIALRAELMGPLQIL
jgi:hypothetical protein